jgi:hypothetical protein
MGYYDLSGLNTMMKDILFAKSPKKRIRQQYPVIVTGWTSLPQVPPECQTTHTKNLCPLGSSAAGFSTLGPAGLLKEPQSA